MIPLKLPKDALVMLDHRLAASVEPPDSRATVLVTISPVRRRGAVPLRVLAAALAFAGGFAMREVARYPLVDAAAADEMAALRREMEAPPPPALRRAPPPETGAAPPRRPPATVVRPENRPAPRPDADPFGLAR